MPICSPEEEEEEEREQQYDLINGLKNSVQTQREQLRSVQRENRQSSIDMEAVRINVLLDIVYQKDENLASKMMFFPEIYVQDNSAKTSFQNQP